MAIIDFMKFYSCKTFATLSIFLIALQMQLPSCSNSFAKPVSLPENQQTLPRNRLCEMARSITVVILSADGKPLGSGFLIHRRPADEKGFFYYKVVTNGHVIPQGPSYQIKTVDEAIHKAILIARFDEGDTGDDLGILQFSTSKNDYKIAQLAPGLALSPQKKDQVLAAGFPVTTGIPKPPEFVCTEIGEISLVIKQPMRRGYRIGYILDIRRGMSGGPLLNLKGEVVGVNGKNNNPIGGGDRLYAGKDGSLVPEFRESRDLVIRSSWAIPTETVVPLARSQGIKIAPLPTPPSAVDQQEKQTATNSDPSVIPNNSSVQPSPQESSISRVEDLARQITVRVRIGNFQRSGILISKQPEETGQIYTVLTYQGTIESNFYRIQTHDGQIHGNVNSPEFVQADGNKLVRLKFKSTNNYKVASLQNPSSLSEGGEVFSAGYLDEQSDGNKKPMRFQFTHGKIIVLRYGDGDTREVRQLGLTNNIQEAMIGGPLLNREGKIVGINGRNNYSSGGWKYPSDTNPEYKYSWAIPIEVYTQSTLNKAHD
jgi:S1-C subfamily serine protease